MNKLLLTGAALALTVSMGTSIAGDIAAGKATYAAKGCVACHGADGKSTAPQYPNVAGQKAQYATLALKAYQDGSRTSINAAAMTPMSKLLNDEEIANVAAYLESLK